MYIFYTRATIVMGQGLSQDWPGLDFLGLDQSSDDLDLQIKIVIGRSLFDLIADHFLPFF